jgi:AcrR family transcriptional regulator
MRARGKKGTHKDGFRREILDAARDLYANEGYEKFSMPALAERTGHSAAAIDSCFKDKDDLLLALCEEVAERFFDDLTDIRMTHPDPHESLRQALLYLIAFGSSNRNEYKVLFITRPQVYGPFDEFMEKESMARNAYSVFREMVKNCVETGKLLEMDIDVLTQVLTVATRGLALAVDKTSFPWVDRNVLAHTLIEGLLRGYRRLPDNLTALSR